MNDSKQRLVTALVGYATLVAPVSAEYNAQECSDCEIEYSDAVGSNYNYYINTYVPYCNNTYDANSEDPAVRAANAQCLDGAAEYNSSQDFIAFMNLMDCQERWECSC